MHDEAKQILDALGKNLNMDLVTKEIRERMDGAMLQQQVKNLQLISDMHACMVGMRFLMDTLKMRYGDDFSFGLQEQVTQAMTESTELIKRAEEFIPKKPKE